MHFQTASLIRNVGVVHPTNKTCFEKAVSFHERVESGFFFLQGVGGWGEGIEGMGG